MSTVPTTNNVQSAVNEIVDASNNALQIAAQSLISGSTGNTSDVNALVTALVNSKIAGQTATIAAAQGQDNTEISAYGTLSAALSALQASLGTLSDGTALNAFTATASGTGLTATAGDGAVAGSYSVDVKQIATAQVLTSAGIDAKEQLGTGTLTLQLGGQSMDVTIDSTNNTVAGIAAAINSASNNPGITATVVNGSDGAHLVLHSASTGGANAISISVNQTTKGTGTNTLSDFAVASTAGSSPGATSLGANATLDANGNQTSGIWTQTTAGQDASLTIDGTQVTSATNAVSDALTGVTLNLTADSVDPTGKAPQTVQVSQDTSKQSDAINQFVSLYNTLVTTMGTLTSFTAGSSSQGVLLGDSTLNMIQGQLASIVATGVKSGNTTTSLASIGVELQADGTLQIDSTKLNDALQNDQGTVAKLFDSTTGVAAQLNDNITDYLSLTGAITTRTNALQDDLKSLASQQTTLNGYQAQLTSMYTAQFTALNTLLASMNSNQQYLTQLFGGQNSAGALATNR